jgi:hypothetical protein
VLHFKLLQVEHLVGMPPVRRFGQVERVDLREIERWPDGARQCVAPEEEHLQRLELPELGQVQLLERVEPPELLGTVPLRRFPNRSRTTNNAQLDNSDGKQPSTIVYNTVTAASRCSRKCPTWTTLHSSACHTLLYCLSKIDKVDDFVVS